MSFFDRAQKIALRAPNLPDHFANVTLAGIKNADVKAITEDYLSKFWEAADAGIAPVLAGKVGTYKTYAACVIARRVYEIANITVDFFDTAREVPMLDRGWYDGHAQKRLSQLASAPLLIVDDFARIRETGRDKAIMDEIGNIRYNSGLPTIWTGNINVSAKDTKVAELVGDAFARRLLERSTGFRLLLG